MDAFPAHYCASTVHHPPSPQVVEFPVASACWADEEKAQGRHCDDMRGENVSQVSQREKTLKCGKAYLLLLNSASSFLIPNSNVSRSAGSLQPLDHILSMYDAWIQVNVQTSVEKRTITGCFGWFFCSTDKSQLDGNVSWGLHSRKDRVSKQAVEQISHKVFIKFSFHMCLFLQNHWYQDYLVAKPLFFSVVREVSTLVHIM